MSERDYYDRIAWLTLASGTQVNYVRVCTDREAALREARHRGIPVDGRWKTERIEDAIFHNWLEGFAW